MHACNYDNDVSIDAVEDPIWKPVDEGPSGISMKDRAHGWMSSNAVAGGLNGRQELITQPRTLALVPQKSLIDVRRSGRADYDGHHRRRLRIR